LGLLRSPSIRGERQLLLGDPGDFLSGLRLGMVVLIIRRGLGMTVEPVLRRWKWLKLK
jgi:hypothetical protein